jgi:ATP-dependent DNA ligase
MKHQLISRDSKGKIRVVEISYNWDDEQHGFVIHRVTGLLNGKMTEQPDIVILKGKASRTLQQQVDLEYASNKKKYLDKGYKELIKPLNEYTSEELDDILGSVRTGQDGCPKPQLAKQADKVTSKKTFDKKYWASRKIDGLRCLIYMGDDGELHTASRGAMNYDAAMYEILSHPDLVKLFQENEGLIMDGECYRHGYSLQAINSVARTQVKAVDYEVLQFYWYDIVDLNATATERINRINEMSKSLNLTFDPERQFKQGELRIQHVPHVEVSGWDNIIKLHNDYVEEGWEGLVIRLQDSVYGPNKRTNDWIKVKVYKQETFKVIGIEQGLRHYDDMVFVLETEDGIPFKAKPFGDRNQKIEYTDNFEEKYKGHLGDVKFFYYSDENCPLQPSFIAFRPDLE